jgi:preprotein translocase subunit SecG
MFGNILVGLLVVFFLFVSASLILVVLIQRPQGGGLSGAFGGGSGSGQTAFGAKVGDVLTYATVAIFVLFLATAIGLNFVIQPSEGMETPAVSNESDTGTGEETPLLPDEGTTSESPDEETPETPGDQPPAEDPGNSEGDPADDQTTEEPEQN